MLNRHPYLRMFLELIAGIIIGMVIYTLLIYSTYNRIKMGDFDQHTVQIFGLKLCTIIKQGSSFKAETDPAGIGRFELIVAVIFIVIAEFRHSRRAAAKQNRERS